MGGLPRGATALSVPCAATAPPRATSAPAASPAPRACPVGALRCDCSAPRNLGISGPRETHGMQDLAFGSRVRRVRLRLGLRQEDVAARSSVSPATVSRVERGHLDSLSIGAIRAVASTLEIRVDLVPRWRGGDLDRLVSARHARLAEVCIGRIRNLAGWTVRPEVSFSIYGERGVIDLLAWHADRRMLLVIELKTEIIDIGELLGTLDRKARLGRGVAADLGWLADAVSVCLIVADGRTNRRRVAEHSGTFRAALPDDGRRFRAWLRDPSARVGALTFMPDRHPGTVRPSNAATQRTQGPRRIVTASPTSTKSRD